jgi:subtilisin family serine protease/sugar lactone lactonase YvrE
MALAVLLVSPASAVAGAEETQGAPRGAGPGASTYPQLAQRDLGHAEHGFEAGGEHQTPTSGRYIVVLKNTVDHAGTVAEAQTDERGGDLGFVYRSALHGYSVSGLSKSDVESLRKDPRVRYVVTDGRVHALSQTVPTGVSRTFATENKALDIDGVDDVRVNADVAVIDTGIDYTHPDLNVVSRVNCIPANEEEKASCVTNSGTDGDGHGTHVAGTIGAIDNGFGVVGVAPGVRLWAVRVLNNNGEGYDSWIIAGVDWVTAHASEIEVANMSLGGEGQLPTLETALDASLNAGVVYTVAAGNEETNAEWQHPANDPDVITVSALSDTDGKAGGIGAETCGWGSDDTLARFSNWGSRVDIAAPGSCIYSTWKEGAYEFDSGTSMASPHVAGAAAILASKSNPNSRADVESIRNALVEGGNFNWRETSNDSQAEPLLYLGEKALTGVEVGTGGYTSANGENATLYGSINPRGQALEYYFEYGPTTEYGQKASLNPGKLGVGAKYQHVSQSVTGLQAEHLYHYRLVAKTESGNVYGVDHSFRPSFWATQTPTNIPAHQYGEWLNDVSCAAAGSCMAVGHYYNSDNLLSSYELAGGQWTFRSAPVPTGAGVEGFAELNGVSCSAANACTAVGKVQMQGGIVVPLAERWDGSSWSIQTIPSPSNSPYARLLDVSCVSASECVAVGYYKNTSGVWVNLSERWKSGSWSLLSTPNIEGATESELGDVSCTSATFCMAVGRSEGPHVPLSMVWDGTSWSLRKGARESGSLSGVSCTSSQFCMAVTAYPWAEVWNGEKWSTQEWALPSGGEFIWLNSVSCSTASFCRAVGEVYKESRHSSFAETWSNGTWKAQVETRKAEAGSNDYSVSCVLSFGCAAVGGERTGAESLSVETYRSMSTVAASKIGASTVILNGLANPEGLTTSYHFEYGPTTAYGNSIPVPNAGAGSGRDPVEVSQTLTELPAETTYHYRLATVNEKGSQNGEDRIFRTGANPPSQTLTFGSTGSGNGLFNRPKGVAVDKEGNIWVADSENNRVQKFNSKGEFLMKFGTAGAGNGQFSKPQDIAFTSDGKLWVTDSGNARVQEFDATGKYLAQFGSYGTAAGKLVFPKGIAIAPDGNIWITDHLFDRVQEFTASGEFIRAVGEAGYNGNGQTSFHYPDGIAVGSDGRVWVADRGHDKVQILSSTGQYLGGFGVSGEGIGELREPSAIEIKPSGDVLVTDRTLGRIQQFDPSGNYVTKFGRGDGWVSEQEGIAIAPQGVVYVVQGNTDGVDKWEDPSPEVVTQAATAITANGATLVGTVNPRGLSTSYRFEYGTTTSYGTSAPVPNESVGSGVEPVTKSKAIAGLASNTTYHYRIVASNSEGTSFGADKTLTTLKLPKATTEAATEVKATTATLKGTVNPEGSATAYQFEYGKTTAYGNKIPASPKSVGSGTSNVAVSEAINGLAASTVYHYRVVAISQAGTTNGADKTLTTPSTAPAYQSSFGSSGTGNGQFAHPAGSALDASGNLWVVDEGNDRVQKFNEKGEYLTKFGSSGSGNGQFGRPTDVAIDAKGNLWVTDTTYNRVEEFNEKGEYVTKFGSLGSGNGQFAGGGPEAISIDSKGNIWVADTYNGRVQKFNEKGEFVKVIGSKGSGAGQLGEATGIDIGLNGNVWVADWQYNRVVEFSEAGEYLRQFGAEGTGNGQFKRPDVVEVDSKGNVWVGDQNNSRVQGFTETGEYLTQFGTAGSGAGQFAFGYPMGISTDAKGNLWVSDTNNNRVQRWLAPTPPPAYQSSFGSWGDGNGQLAHPAGSALDASGNLWVVDEGNDRVQKFSEKGEYLTKFGSSGSGNGQFGRPTDVAIDAKGNLWVTDASCCRVQKFNEKGEYLSQFGSFGSGNGQFASGGPEAIAIDSKGNIWVADTYNGRVQKFNEKGEFVKVISSKGSGAGQLGEPTGVDIGLNGNVWVADWQYNRVVEFNESGEYLRQFGTEGTGNGQFKHPDVVEVDSKGNVWVADQDNSRVQEFTETGEYLTQFGAAGSGPAQFSFVFAMGISSDAKGNLWVSDTNNNRVQRWGP